MAQQFSRTRRIADQMQRDLAMLIQQEVKDPRVGMVTINNVKVSKDLSYADVYFTCMALDDSDSSKKQSETVLNGAASFLRTMLAKGLSLRVIPQLRFHYDDLLGEGHKLSRLIDDAVQSDLDRQGQDES
ncbi:30S ribosome-binding factor RbfA [Gynuella sp.]|uniref:30S ribosome-binding factor RbfA n=1 Tax=Gynuella sp. TaxID=2969146 RepID=UPI003D120242